LTEPSSSADICVQLITGFQRVPHNKLGNFETNRSYSKSVLIIGLPNQ
jgi:hypothetical protein